MSDIPTSTTLLPIKKKEITPQENINMDMTSTGKNIKHGVLLKR